MKKTISRKHINALLDLLEDQGIYVRAMQDSLFLRLLLIRKPNLAAVSFLGNIHINDNCPLSTNSLFATILHEAIHAKDRKKNPLKYFFSYFSPQIYITIAAILLGLGAMFLPALFLVSLTLFAVLGLPWISKGRFYLEERGHTANLAVEYWTTSKISDKHIKDIARKMSSKTYWFMMTYSYSLSKMRARAEQIKTAETYKKYHWIPILKEAQQLIGER